MRETHRTWCSLLVWRHISINCKSLLTWGTVFVLISVRCSMPAGKSPYAKYGNNSWTLKLQTVIQSKRCTVKHKPLLIRSQRRMPSNNVAPPLVSKSIGRGTVQRLVFIMKVALASILVIPCKAGSENFIVTTRQLQCKIPKYVNHLKTAEEIWLTGQTTKAKGLFDQTAPWIISISARIKIHDGFVHQCGYPEANQNWLFILASAKAPSIYGQLQIQIIPDPGLQYPRIYMACCSSPTIFAIHLSFDASYQHDWVVTHIFLDIPAAWLVTSPASTGQLVPIRCSTALAKGPIHPMGCYNHPILSWITRYIL